MHISAFASYSHVQLFVRPRKAYSGPLHFESFLKDNTPNTNSAHRVKKEEKFEEVISNVKTCLRTHEDGNRHLKNFTTSKQVDFCTTPLEASDNIQHNANLLHGYEANSITTTTTYIRQETSHKSGETSSVEAATSLHHYETIEQKKDNEETTVNCDMRHDPPHPIQSSSNLQENNLQIVETAAYWEADFPHPEDGWEDLQSDYQSKEASNIDWIGEVSRPRSDWEYLRQERYQEMLDPFSENEEIRALLGR